MDISLMWVAIGLVLLVLGFKLMEKMIQLALFCLTAAVVAGLIFWFYEDLATYYNMYVTPYIAGSYLGAGPFQMELSMMPFEHY